MRVKLSYLDILGIKFGNTIAIFKKHPQTCPTLKFHEKEITLDLEEKILYLGFFSLKFENTFEISIFQLAQMETVLLKERTLDLEPKMSYFFFRLKKNPFSYVMSPNFSKN